MHATRAKVDSAGRILIPAEYRRALGMEPGTRVSIVLQGNELRVLTIREAIRQAQETARAHRPAGGPSVVDEFLAERRAEAARE